MKLDFKPLKDRGWIKNAIIQVNEYFNLSISYGDGLWYVGERGSYEVAIQVSTKENEYNYRSLVELPDNPQTNIYSHCNDQKIEQLIEIAKTLEFGGEIQVFAIVVGQTSRAWGHRFYCAKGHDQKEKLKYVKSIFTDEDSWRFIQPDGKIIERESRS